MSKLMYLAVWRYSNGEKRRLLYSDRKDAEMHGIMEGNKRIIPDIEEVEVHERSAKVHSRSDS